MASLSVRTLLLGFALVCLTLTSQNGKAGAGSDCAPRILSISNPDNLMAGKDATSAGLFIGTDVTISGACLGVVDSDARVSVAARP